MDIQISVNGTSDKIFRFDHRGHLNGKELRRFFRNAELSKELFYSEIINSSSDPDLIKAWFVSAVAQIAVTKAMIIETRSLGAIAVTIQEFRDKNDKEVKHKKKSLTKVPMVSLSVWDNGNVVTGIDLKEVLVKDIYTQAHNEDFIALVADKTNW